VKLAGEERNEAPAGEAAPTIPRAASIAGYACGQPVWRNAEGRLNGRYARLSLQVTSPLVVIGASPLSPSKTRTTAQSCFQSCQFNQLEKRVSSWRPQ
jgi:hypothetical protein